MSFSLTKPGGWSFGELLTSVQMEDIDAKTANAIDGVGGGTYAPSTPITLGGDGLAVTGDFACSGVATFTNTVTFTGNVNIGNSFSDTCIINAQVTFNQDIVFANDVQIGNGSNDIITVDGTMSCTETVQFAAGFTADGDCTLTGDLEVNDLDVTGDVHVGDDLDVGDDLTVDGDATIGSSSSDSLTVNASLANRLRFTGNGRVPERYMLLPDSSSTIGVEDGNVFRVRSNLSAFRTYTISTSGAAEGDRMFFFTPKAGPGVLGNGALISCPDNTQNFTFAAGSNSQWCELIFDGSDWLNARES